MVDRPDKENDSIIKLQKLPDSHEPASLETVESARNDAPRDSRPAPSGLPLVLMVAGLAMSVFLVALDMSIVATAVPRITADFHSLADAGWYGSGFLSTLAAFQTIWGKAYRFYPTKIVFMLAVGVFEFGSLLCGIAVSSEMLIAGRAVAGVGAAGVTGGCYTIVALATKPESRPTYIGLLGCIYSVAGVSGPLLGGVFAERVSWRWCFLINLPLGGTALAVVAIFYKNLDPPKPARPVGLRVILEFDVPGLVLFVGALVLFILALDVAGTSASWNSAFVVGGLAGSGLLLLCFAIEQFWRGSRALICPKFLSNRTVLMSVVFLYLMNSANLTVTYSMPVYFQATRGSSPAESGIHNVPLVLSAAFATLASGRVFSFFRHPRVFLFGGAALAAVGVGMIYTLTPSSSPGLFIGYQIIFGAGIGTCLQIPMIVCHSLVPISDVSSVTGLVMFFQLASGAIAVSVSQSVLINVAISWITAHVPGISSDDVTQAGSSNLAAHFTTEQVALVVTGYMEGLRAAWIVAMSTAGAAALAGTMI